MTERYLIVGLGNPGRKHKKNRHNIGFLAVDVFADRHALRFSRMQGRALLADERVGSAPVLVAKPQTFMNNSGSSVKELVAFYKLPLENLMIVYDELDLPLGTIRSRPEGGAGGHNGMRDIIWHLGSNHFSRMRLGISRPPGKMNPVAYVLKDFGKGEQALLDETLERAASALDTWLRDGITLTMSRHNSPAPGGE